MKKIPSSLFLIVLALLFLSCQKNKSDQKDAIAMIQIIDRNGTNETISSPDRVKKLQNSDFLEPQPYEKVVRIYKKNEEGKTTAKLTTYHENGQIWQYLETVGGRAKGIYKEWYPNGNLRMSCEVIEGLGDLNPGAEATWIFHKKNTVYAEDGTLLAEIFYEKGELEGDSIYYHPDGTVAKVIPYHHDKIEGALLTYNREGELIGKIPYLHGKKQGDAFFKGDAYIPKREESYEKGYLISGKYWDFNGDLISEIIDGSGMRPVFEEGVLKREYQYKEGEPEGLVRTYRDNGTLESEYHIVGGQKQGEEKCFYEKRKASEDPLVMLLLHWKDDEIHGIVRTWYSNGNLESEKEMAHNKKQGMLLAWYLDGSLMMVEEYEQDSLVTGKYFKKGEDIPTTKVIGGNGIATIFDPEGNFVRKIEYRKGWPYE